MRLMISVGVAAVLLAGCASAGGSTATDRNVLTRAQIQDAHHTNVYDLVQAERPWWLRVRGAKSLTQETPIMVYVDGSEVGSVEVLRSLSPYDYREIRFYSGGRAQVRFGSGNVSGAIELLTP